jgi:hypothetical protein
MTSLAAPPIQDRRGVPLEGGALHAGRGIPLIQAKIVSSFKGPLQTIPSHLSSSSVKPLGVNLGSPFYRCRKPWRMPSGLFSGTLSSTPSNLFYSTLSSGFLSHKLNTLKLMEKPASRNKAGW